MPHHIKYEVVSCSAACQRKATSKRPDAAARRCLRGLVLEEHADFRTSYGRRNLWAACWRNIVRTFESLSSSTAPSRTLLFVISFVARAFLSARGSWSSSTAAWRTLRLVSSFEAMVILFKICSSLCYSA